MMDGWNYLREVHLGQGFWPGKESDYPAREGVKESVDGMKIVRLRDLKGNCVSWYLRSNGPRRSSWLGKHSLKTQLSRACGM